MDRFYYEIVAAADGAHHVPAVQALIASDPTLAEAAEPWSRKTPPLQSDLYALLIIASAGIAADAVSRSKVAHATGGDFPVIPVVEDLSAYDFGNAPIGEIGERNAEGLNSPDRLMRTLLHHGGLRLFEGGGRVFISYARADGSALAEAVRTALLGAGIGQTVDVHAFAGGDVIQDDIAESIREADLVILIDSKGAAKSRWVAEEMDIAHAARVHVIAVTPAAGGFHHAFHPPHVEWSPGTDAAQAVLAVARRVLARKRAFHVRVARMLGRLASLRSWSLAKDGDRWLVTGARLRPLRVAGVDRPPVIEDLSALRRIIGGDRGLLVAGTRSFQPETDDAFRRAGGRAIRSTPLPTMASQIPSHATRRPLAKRRVFLSAAMPSDPDEIDLARLTLAQFVVSLTQSLVELGATLVFGGHPSVTPLVHRVLAGVSGVRKGRVELHQARMWQADSISLPQKIRQGVLFRGAQWHGAGLDAAADVAALRDGMIVDTLDAGVFVGGKTTGFIGSKPGIIDEYERFTAACPAKPTFVVGVAGGAARSIPSDGSALGEVLRARRTTDGIVHDAFGFMV